MKVKEVGTRGLLVTFEDPYFTTLYVIKGVQNIFFCDTFLGPDPINALLEYLGHEINNKNILIFNSHADYDHIWGNCHPSFKKQLIIAHKRSIDRLNTEGKAFLEKYAQHQQGNVYLVYPTLLFSDSLVFREEEIEIHFTPGHTEDSASVYDRLDKTLFVGDNIECPLPYINSLRLNEYAETLKSYFNFDTKYIITGHTDLLTNTKLLEENLDYVENFKRLTIKDKHIGSIEAKKTHFTNCQVIAKKFQDTGNLKKAEQYFIESKHTLNKLKATLKKELYESQLKTIKQALEQIKINKP